MAAKRTIKSEATTEGADPVGGRAVVRDPVGGKAVVRDPVGGKAVVRTGRGGIGSPSLRTRILQPRFKCVAHCKNMSEEGNFN